MNLNIELRLQMRHAVNCVGICMPQMFLGLIFEMTNEKIEMT